MPAAFQIRDGLNIGPPQTNMACKLEELAVFSLWLEASSDPEQVVDLIHPDEREAWLVKKGLSPVQAAPRQERPDSHGGRRPC